MANIILIEDDPKLRSQIEALILELSPDHKLRFFSNSDEFEKLYFGEEKEYLDLEKEGPLAALDPSLFNQLCKENLSQQPFSLGKNQPPKPLEDLIKIISSAVMTDFQQSWSTFVEQMRSSPSPTDDNSCRQLVALSNKKSSVWVVELFPLLVPGQALTLGFKDWTPDLRSYVQQQGQGEEDELRLFSSIQMIMARSGCLNPKLKVTQWVESCFQQLSARGYSSPEARTCFTLLKYEDDGVSKLDLLHPLIDDLIYLPIDRLLFLQKTEILLGLPGASTPRFLFNQQAQIEIEISKISQVDFLSEVGLRVRNPVPLVTGLAAHFYLTLPKEPEPLSLFAKVTDTSPHPNVPGQFLVEFHFFGLSAASLRSLRLYLRTHEGYRSLRSEDEEPFRFQKDNIFLEEKDRKPKQVVIIDSDPSLSQQIKTALSEDMDQVEVLSSSSYYLFLKKHLEGYSPQGEWEWAQEEDFYTEDLSCTLDRENESVVHIEPQPKAEDQILGHGAQDLLTATTGGWKKLFSDPLSEAVFQESLDVALVGDQTVEQRLLLSQADGSLKMTDVRISPAQDEGQVVIHLKAPPPQPRSPVSDSPTLDSLDLLIINQALLPPDVASWWTGFQEAVKAKGLIPPHLQVPVLLIAKEGKLKSIEPFLQAPIDQLMIFSGETRPILMASAHLMSHPYTRYCSSNIVWQMTSLPIHIAKKSLLEQVAEFGASIRHPRPIQPGTFLYLRGSIFDQAPNRNLCARFYRTEPHPSEAGEHLCHLLYFGINDSFLKYTRSWFRETYAASKQGD